MPPRTKYGAKRITVDGIKFPSRHEARVYGDLLTRQRAGEIRHLRRQVAVPLVGLLGPILTPTGKPMRYIADFAYDENGQGIFADAKGYPSPIYLMKRAILAAMGIDILEL